MAGLSLRPWLVRLAKGDPHARSQLDRLGKQDAALLPDLLECFGDREQSIRFWAMTAAAGLLRHEVHTPGLHARLRDRLADPKFGCRQMALTLVVEAGDVALLPRVRRLLAHDPSLFVRESAADVLGALGTTQELPALIRVLRDDELAWAAAIAIKLIAVRHGLGRHRAHLTRLAQRHLERCVRDQLAVAISQPERP